MSDPTPSPTDSTPTPPDPFDVPLAELRERTSVKWRVYPPDVLPLWVAEMDVRQAPAVVDAVGQAMTRGDTGYDMGVAYGEAWARFAADRWGWAVDPAATRLVPDVMIGITEALRVLTDPGDAVVVSPPVYPPFVEFTRGEGRRVVDAPLTAEGRLDLADDGALARAFAVARGAGRAVYLLANPHNPTGTAHTPAELERLMALAEAAGVRVVSDEIHAPVADAAAPYTPLLTVPGGERAMALVSASKAFNLAGLKAALLVAGDAARDDLARVPEHASHGASHLAVIAHVAALDHGRDWLDAVLGGLARRRAELVGLLAEHLPGARYQPDHATYLAWVDLRGCEGPAGSQAGGPVGGLGDDPARVFLERGRVAVNPGPSFGTGGEGHVRVNIATSQGILAEAVRRMGASARE